MPTLRPGVGEALALLVSAERRVLVRIPEGALDALDTVLHATSRDIPEADSASPYWGRVLLTRLAAAGYTVVKLPTVAELDAAIDNAFGPHDHTAEFCDGCTAGELVLSVLGVRSLPESR